MGIIKEYKCSSCRKTWKLFTGHGMKHSTLNHILDIFPADLQVEILKDEDVSGVRILWLFLFSTLLKADTLISHNALNAAIRSNFWKKMLIPSAQNA